MERSALLIVGAGETFSRVLTQKNAASRPLGALSVAAALMMHGWRVNLLDLTVTGMSRAGFRSLVGSQLPGLVGIGCCTEEFGGALAVAREVREASPSSTIVMGGPHPTFEPEAALESGCVDYVVLREGESTIVELTACLQGQIAPRDVRGIAYLEDGTVVVTEARPLLDRLDQLPLAPFALVPPIGYIVDTTAVSSRGCPGGCIFCASGALSGRRYRARSAEHLFSEIYYRLLRTGQRYFVLLDDTFTGDERRVNRFCRLISQSGLNATWRCDSRVERASPDMMATLAHAGCTSIHYGIESGDQRILDAIGKRTTLGQAEAAVALAAQHGITPMCSFIIGHPDDTEESVARTFELARRFRRDYGAINAFACLVPYPGTQVRARAKELGVKIEVESLSEHNITNVVISTRHLSQDRLRELMFDAAVSEAR